MVEKTNPNGQLKSEFILVCNSIRNDLLHSNEFIRAKTLKMLTRVMHLGILEPLKPSILENIKHKLALVRKNAVALLNRIYTNFKGFLIILDELTPDIDVAMLDLLHHETDPATQRNALLLLF
jgi:coatomer subunit beta